MFRFADGSGVCSQRHSEGGVRCETPPLRPGMIQVRGKLIPWRGSKAANEITMVQAQPKHLANIRRENDLRASAGLALCGKRGALAGDAAVTRGQQEGVNFTTSCLQGDAGDLP